jgi:transcriptional regulator with XRE-family HTH domain
VHKMTTFEDIGRRVRLARQEMGLLQADLGRMLEQPRSHAAISDIERGRRKLDMSELDALAKVLQKPLSYFTEPNPTSVVYRRSDRLGSIDQRQEVDSAIEAFKRVARERHRARVGK